MSGYGLASSAPNGVPTSEFMVVADKFTIAPVATNPAAADGSPFYHLTVPTIIDGVTVPAGTYMKSAFIADASINNAKIGNAAIDDAKISNVSAGKISTGLLDSGRINTNTLVVKHIDVKSATSGARVEMKNTYIKVYDESGMLRVIIGDLTA